MDSPINKGGIQFETGGGMLMFAHQKTHSSILTLKRLSENEILSSVNGKEFLKRILSITRSNRIVSIWKCLEEKSKSDYIVTTETENGGQLVSMVNIGNDGLPYLIARAALKFSDYRKVGFSYAKIENNESFKTDHKNYVDEKYMTLEPFIEPDHIYDQLEIYKVLFMFGLYEGLMSESLVFVQNIESHTKALIRNVLAETIPQNDQGQIYAFDTNIENKPYEAYVIDPKKLYFTD